MNGVLQAGTAKIDITPPLTIPYLGYEPRHAFFHGVHDPLYARALAVESDDGGTRAVLITADSLGYSNDILGPGRNFTAEVRQRVQARTGVPAEHVMLAASHAHSTPETVNLRPLLDTPAAGPWLEVLIDQLTSTAVLAVARQRPSRLKAATGAVKDLGWSRRVIGKDGKIYAWRKRPPDDQIADWGSADPEVSVLSFDAVEGGSRILVTNFACHPVTVQVQPLISADFPGAAMDVVERTIPGCESSLFTQGACGDQDPVGGDTRDFEDVQRYGLMLAGEVIKLAARLGGPSHPDGPPTVAVMSEYISLPGRDLPPRGPVQAAYDQAERGLAEAETDEERKRLAVERRLAEEALIQIDRGNEPVLAEVQVLRLGDVAIVGLPGEPFVDMGLEIKRRSAAPYPVVVSYANDYLGYFATPAAWKQGGYEVGHGPWSRVGPEGSGLLVEKAVDMIGGLWDR